MTRARSLSQLANSNVFSVDANNSRVGIGSTIPDVKLDVGGDIVVRTDNLTINNLIGIISAADFLWCWYFDHWCSWNVGNVHQWWRRWYLNYQKSKD
jgi:hypothetical protein